MTINERTKISLFAIAAVVPTFIGFVLWLAALQAKAESTEKTAIKLEMEQDKQFEVLTQIRDDVLIIKEQLKQKQAKGE